MTSKSLEPLMTVVQQNRSKVRPLMDYRELNVHVDAYTADADVCASKLRECRRKGSNVALLDLRCTSINEYQTVTFQVRRYFLSRLEFGLNVNPK